MASTYLSKTFSSDGNRKTFTISFWLKKCKIPSSAYYWILGTGTTTSDSGLIYFDSNNLDQLSFFNSSGDILRTSKAFRDTNAWSHIVYSVDTTQATSSDRVKLYVNGEQQTSFSIESYPAQNTDMNFNRAQSFDIGRDSRTTGGTGAYLDGSLAHFHFIDGTAYDADTFGQTDSLTGIWKPKTVPSVTYGTNGFFLKFENSSAFGTDSSGNGNTFTVNGTMTQTIDTPSNVFAVFNANMPQSINYEHGNTTVSQTTDANYRPIPCTMAISKGKYYAEFKAVSGFTNINLAVGYINVDETFDNDTHIATWTYGGSYGANGRVGYDGTNNDGNPTFTNGDIIGIAIDLDNNYIYYHKNGTYINSGDPTSGSSGTGGFTVTGGKNYALTAVTINFNGTAKWSANFGNGFFGTTQVSSAQNPDDGIGIFEYDVPTGYRALCTKSINAEEYS